MWNSITESELKFDIKITHCHGGIAPLRQDQALHTYQQKKQMHAEMGRRTNFWKTIQTGIASLAKQVVYALHRAAMTGTLVTRRVFSEIHRRDKLETSNHAYSCRK
jgi:hypothetical protein